MSPDLPLKHERKGRWRMSSGTEDGRPTPVRAKDLYVGKLPLLAASSRDQRVLLPHPVILRKREPRLRGERDEGPQREYHLSSSVVARSFPVEIPCGSRGEPSRVRLFRLERSPSLNITEVVGVGDLREWDTRGRRSPHRP